MDHAQTLYPSLSSLLALLFFKVPHVAGMIMSNISFKDTIRVMLRTEPALYNFFRGPAGGLDRLLKMRLNASPLAVLFFKAPNVADAISFELEM